VAYYYTSYGHVCIKSVSGRLDAGRLVIGLLVIGLLVRGPWVRGLLVRGSMTQRAMGHGERLVTRTIGHRTITL